MERERQTVMLAMITLFIYAFSMFIQKGMLAFPFPLNEFILFAVTVYFSFFHFRSDKLSYTLMLLLALVSLLGNQMLWSFFMDNEAMQTLSQSTATDILRILREVFIIAGITRFYDVTRWKISPLIYPVVLLSYVAGMLLNMPLLQIAGMLLFTGMLTYNYRKGKPAMETYSRSLYYLWYLVTFLYLTMLLTIYLNNYFF